MSCFGRGNRFRLCQTLGDISTVLIATQNDRTASHKNLCYLTEFREDLMKECFAICLWTEEHQKQLTGLQPVIERYQLCLFLQSMLIHTNTIGVPSEMSC